MTCKSWRWFKVFLFSIAFISYIISLAEKVLKWQLIFVFASSANSYCSKIDDWVAQSTWNTHISRHLLGVIYCCRSIFSFFLSFFVLEESNIITYLTLVLNTFQNNLFDAIPNNFFVALPQRNDHYVESVYALFPLLSGITVEHLL